MLKLVPGGTKRALNKAQQICPPGGTNKALAGGRGRKDKTKRAAAAHRASRPCAGWQWQLPGPPLKLAGPPDQWWAVLVHFDL